MFSMFFTLIIKWLILSSTLHKEIKIVTIKEHFARQDSGLTQIFKPIICTSEKILDNINEVK